MSSKELRHIAEKLVAMRRFSLATGCQTGKSQGALIKNLTPDETAEVADITLEMMKNEQLTK